MQLVHLMNGGGRRWSFEGRMLPRHFALGFLLELPQKTQVDFLRSIATSEDATGGLLPPIEREQEVWGAGVTYQRSSDARQEESLVSSLYDRVYNAQRPELFFKSLGWRVIGPEGPVRVRADSAWNVPEPEVVLVLNQFGEICGYTAGNDVSSRDIEGENPLYLPQAKVYNGSCALGPHIILLEPGAELPNLNITMTIWREGKTLFQGQTGSFLMKRNYSELTTYLFSELHFPSGVFLMAGTGIVPPNSFSLRHGDDVLIGVGKLSIRNRVTH